MITPRAVSLKSIAALAALTLLACGGPGTPDAGTRSDDDAGTRASHDAGGGTDGGSTDDGGIDPDGGSGADAGSSTDAGPTDDGGVTTDAGADAGVDAGVDAGPTCGSCDDGNACTADHCTATGCAHDVLDGPSCDDGNACTTSDSCVSGTCVGASVSCAPPRTCQLEGTCNPATGTCSYPALDAGTPCDDASDTTSADVCTTLGTCAGTLVTCPPSDTCTTYAPNGTATCTATRHDGRSCEDADACTPTGTCSNGLCTVGAPISCTNGGTCASGACACPATWSGPTCATDVNECSRLACGGGSNCTNTPGSYSCACMTNYSSPTGANCTSTVATLEVVLFYDESVVLLYGDQTRARLANLFNHAKTAYDSSLTPPPLTLSLNAIVRMEPLPSAVQKRACNTTLPNTSCTGCYQGGSSGSCGNLLSNDADEIDTDQLLASFQVWVSSRRASLEAQYGVFDVPVFVTAADFASSVTGLATVSGACRSQGAATISLASRPSERAAGAVLAHELGHTLGMSHDASSGFIMASASNPTNPATAFSSMSLAAYQTWRNNLGAANCIADFASHDWTARTCGNGVVEAGEACDPGVATDSCCVSCQLAAGCQCANSEPCCANGAFRSSGTTCRAARGECDLADTCDGVSSTCRDQYKSPREPCSNNGGLCLWGACASRTEQCRAPAQPGSPEASSTGCETSTRCDRLDCSRNLACDYWWSIVAADGTRCGAANQCASGLCVPSTALKQYAWAPGAWTACTGGTQTRTVLCLDEAGATALESMCDPDARPVTTRACP